MPHLNFSFLSLSQYLPYTIAYPNGRVLPKKRSPTHIHLCVIYAGQMAHHHTWTYTFKQLLLSIFPRVGDAVRQWPRERDTPSEKRRYQEMSGKLINVAHTHNILFSLSNTPHSFFPFTQCTLAHERLASCNWVNCKLRFHLSENMKYLPTKTDHFPRITLFEIEY